MTQLINTMVLMIAVADQGNAISSPRTVVEAMFEAFNRHDATGMARLYAEDARLSSSDFCTPRQGRAEVLRTYKELFAEFPDIRDEVQMLVTQGDRVAVRFIAKSRQGEPALELPIATFLTVRQGLIQSDESLFDTGGQACRP